jgi:transposase-like protein
MKTEKKRELSQKSPRLATEPILAGFATMIDICQVKYLNNIIEQEVCSGQLKPDTLI